MDTENIQDHKHNGIDSNKIYAGDLVGCPFEPITPKNTNSPSITYGANEQQILANTQTRLNEVEIILQKLGILK